MHNLISINTIKNLMEDHNVTFSKGLGQNFLIDRTALLRIITAADPQPEDTILEVGPGIGTLTSELAKEAGRIIAVEIDQRLLPILDKTLADYENVIVHNGDILKTDLYQLCGDSQAPLKAIANLPYYITTPVIFYLLESGICWERMVFLIQKEVAERIVASPGTRQYGASSVTIQARGEVRIAAIVKAGCFLPRPKVDSAIIIIKPFQNSSEREYPAELFKRVVQKAFSQRRKKVFNALTAKGSLELSRNIWHDIFKECNIDESVRAEQLTIQDFEALTIKIATVIKD